MKIINPTIEGMCAFLLLLIVVPTATAASCSLRVTKSINFGTYNPFRVRANDTAGAIKITCNGAKRNSVSFSLLLGPGEAGHYFSREMKLSNNSRAMEYNLFLDAARTLVWGDGTAGTSILQYTLQNRNQKRFNIYGRIPAKQTLVKVGRYSDSVIVTMNF